MSLTLHDLMAIITLAGTCIFFFDVGIAKGKGIPWSDWVLQTNVVLAFAMFACSLSFMKVIT